MDTVVKFILWFIPKETDPPGESGRESDREVAGRVAVIRRIFWTSPTNLTQKTFQLNSYQTGSSISKQVGTSSIHGCTIAPPSSVFCVFTV